jgi:hypothetical protein
LQKEKAEMPANTLDEYQPQWEQMRSGTAIH